MFRAMIDKFKTSKKKNKKSAEKPRICVFSLTYQRPEYVKRSIESLYARAGCCFDLFVFDDASDKETREVLKKLKEKYEFQLFFNKKHLNIYKNFYLNLDKIPRNYDYYVKFDSDVEILSDNLFLSLLENFEMKGVVGLTPRVEGVANSERSGYSIEFFNGHVIKHKAPIVYGCCLVLSSSVFNSFKRRSKRELEDTDLKWGIDSELYDHALKLGDFLIVEDLSVYHIDNTYGQRRKYADYYIERSRWKSIDVKDVWFIKASKMIAPIYIERENYLRIQKNSADFEEFINNCEIFIKENRIETPSKYLELERRQPEVKIKEFFKVFSPPNFRPDSNIEHGTFKLFTQIPIWAKDNPRLVIEKIKVETNEKSKV